MRAWMLALMVCAIACGDLDSLGTASQDLGSYCGNGHPVACYPWDPDGDWNYCDASCMAFDSSPGYCPPSSDAEYTYCSQPANYYGPHCYLGQPRFTHYCVSGEFPVAPGDEPR